MVGGGGGGGLNLAGAHTWRREWEVRLERQPGASTKKGGLFCFLFWAEDGQLFF